MTSQRGHDLTLLPPHTSNSIVLPGCTALHLQDVQPMHRLDPNPTWNVMDFRAMAEKRRQKAIMDAEWQRQHALLARPTTFTLRLAACLSVSCMSG